MDLVGRPFARRLFITIKFIGRLGSPSVVDSGGESICRLSWKVFADFGGYNYTVLLAIHYLQLTSFIAIYQHSTTSRREFKEWNYAENYFIY